MSVRRKKKAETRQCLVEAAIQTFHKKGIHGTRVSDIVSQAGVAQGTFYNHFQSKEAIFYHIADAYMDYYSTLFSDYLNSMINDDDIHHIIVTIRSFLRRLLLSCRDNIAVAQLVFGEGAGSAGPYQEKCKTVISHFIFLIQTVLEKAHKKGIIANQDPEMSAAMVFGMFQRCMFYFLLTREEFDLDRFERGMTAFLLNGLGLVERPDPHSRP